ncbi:MAG: CDP-diacylglycerol--glycerol-3-phosphate 3-phosphatidyltransferase [Myxococcales bacterium FL481]|nr:MAG: CDP-diacylglycerol--glycerol-3-phosphate 3-phosphatidyltransferase [Myxococcales bacterium FL481]
MSRLDALKREILNLPNLITIGRVFMIPPICLLIDQRDPALNFAAFLFFLIASAMDLLDGWLARRRNLVTFFGKFMDPLADKVMVMALMVYLANEGRIEPWVVVVLLGREFYMSGLRTLALGAGVEIVADSGGKAKTVFQMIGLSLILLYETYVDPLGYEISFHRVGLALLYMSLFLSLVSAYAYTRGFVEQLGRSGAPGE